MICCNEPSLSSFIIESMNASSSAVISSPLVIARKEGSECGAAEARKIKERSGHEDTSRARS